MIFPLGCFPVPFNAVILCHAMRFVVHHLCSCIKCGPKGTGEGPCECDHEAFTPNLHRDGERAARIKCVKCSPEQYIHFALMSKPRKDDPTFYNLNHADFSQRKSRAPGQGLVKANNPSAKFAALPFAAAKSSLDSTLKEVAATLTFKAPGSDDLSRVFKDGEEPSECTLCLSPQLLASA
jgi:hypothetical protein